MSKREAFKVDWEKELRGRNPDNTPLAFDTKHDKVLSLDSRYVQKVKDVLKKEGIPFSEPRISELYYYNLAQGILEDAQLHLVYIDDDGLETGWPVELSESLFDTLIEYIEEKHDRDATDEVYNYIEEFLMKGGVQRW